MMKTLTVLFALTFSVMFSSTSFAGWTKVAVSVDGDTFYVDFERIRKHGGYVYYWDLGDYLRSQGQDGFHNFSVVNYNQVDCALNRRKNLTQIQYKGQMGQGQKRTNNKPDKNWTYALPRSSLEHILKAVCASVK
jgi:hypothetical protein